MFKYRRKIPNSKVGLRADNHNIIPRIVVSTATFHARVWGSSDRQGSNFDSCVWRTVSSHSSHHPQEVLLAQLSLYVHKGGLKPDIFHFLSDPVLFLINIKMCDNIRHLVSTTTLYMLTQMGLSMAHTSMALCTQHALPHNLPCFSLSICQG